MRALLPQTEVRSLMEPRCFVRRAAGEDSLLVSDAPRLLSAGALLTLEDRLTAQGFRVWETDRALLCVDLSDARWAALWAGLACVMPCAIPRDDRLHAPYALARLLAAHPAPLAAQPRGPWRIVLKNYGSEPEMLACVPALHEACAVRLRRRQALPSAAAGLLFAWLADRQEEEKI